MKHHVSVEITGDCYQQRIFDVTDSSRAKQCRELIMKRDIRELIFAVSDEVFGEYLFELNYCPFDDDMNLIVTVDGEERFNGCLSDFEHTKEYQNKNSEIQDSQILPCLVEQISKDATFSCNFEVDDFDIKKLKVLCDFADNTFLGEDKYLTDTIEYNGKKYELDEDSSYDETEYGLGVIDSNWNINCDCTTEDD